MFRSMQKHGLDDLEGGKSYDTILSPLRADQHDARTNTEGHMIVVAFVVVVVLSFCFIPVAVEKIGFISFFVVAFLALIYQRHRISRYEQLVKELRGKHEAASTGYKQERDALQEYGKAWMQRAMDYEAASTGYKQERDALQEYGKVWMQRAMDYEAASTGYKQERDALQEYGRAWMQRAMDYEARIIELDTVLSEWKVASKGYKQERDALQDDLTALAGRYNTEHEHGKAWMQQAMDFEAQTIKLEQSFAGFWAFSCRKWVAERAGWVSNPSPKISGLSERRRFVQLSVEATGLPVLPEYIYAGMVDGHGGAQAAECKGGCLA